MAHHHLITVLIMGGVVLLGLIVVINNNLDRRKVSLARDKAELSDRIRRCTQLTEGLPGRFLSADLKQLFQRIELRLLTALRKLEPHNPQLSKRLQELHNQLNQGTAEPSSAHTTEPALADEAQAKDIRQQLEAAHALAKNAQQGGMISAEEFNRANAEIRHQLVMLQCEQFTLLGRQRLQQGQPQQARLAFDQCLAFLHKQVDRQRYQHQLSEMQMHLARVDAIVLAQAQPASEQASTLSEGLQHDHEGDWKKKNVYD